MITKTPHAENLEDKWSIRKKFFFKSLFLYSLLAGAVLSLGSLFVYMFIDVEALRSATELQPFEIFYNLVSAGQKAIDTASYEQVLISLYLMTITLSLITSLVFHFRKLQNFLKLTFGIKVIRARNHIPRLAFLNIYNTFTVFPWVTSLLIPLILLVTFFESGEYNLEQIPAGLIPLILTCLYIYGTLLLTIITSILSYKFGNREKGKSV